MPVIDPVLGIALVLALVAAQYRVHKRWIRRCKCCGAMWRVRRTHIREFAYIIGGGKTKVRCVVMFQCLNPRCKKYSEPIEIRAYFKDVQSSSAFAPTIF